MANPNLAGQKGNKIDFAALLGLTKNKSSGHWAERLFKQSGGSLKERQWKTYFAHRYHAGPGGSEQTPFGALFSGIVGSKADSELSKDKSKLIVTPGNELSASLGEALDVQLTVLNSYDETPDTKTFRLGSQDGKVLSYLPGQYVSVTVVIAGREYKRCYSLASSPARLGALDITVKRASKEAVVSNWLNDHLKVGDTLSVKGPFGKFTCGENTPRKILFLAAGSGMVPVMSMLRWLTDTEARVDIILLLSFRTPEDIFYSGELKLIAARHKNVKLAVTLTEEPCKDATWLGLTGRVNEKMIAGSVPDLPERAVYLCGPDAFMSACKQNLTRLKLPAEQLFCETFTVTAPQAKIKNPPLGPPSAAKTGKYQIRFTKSCKTVVADGAMTLLELAEMSGIRIGHECRAGSCGECMVKCLKGKIDMTEQAEIDDIDKNKGWVYACCARPVSNAELDI